MQFYQVFRYTTILITGIIFAKSGLPIGAIGNYETLMFIASLVTTFWITGIIKAMLAQYDKKEDDTIRSGFFFNVFVLTSFISILCFFLLNTFQDTLSHQLSNNGYIPYFNLLSWYILLSNPAYLIEYFFLLKNKTKAIFVYGIVISLLQLIAVAGPILCGYSLNYSLYGLIGIAFIKLIILVYLILKYSSLKIDIPFLSKYILLALPLILSNLIASSSEFIDSFIISTHFDSSTFAVFRYGAREFPLTLLLATTFSNSMVTEVAGAENINESLKKIKEKSLTLLYILYPITITLILSSHYLYPIAFNIHFSESASVFNAYLLLIISRLIFPQSILIGLKKNNYILWISVIELIINTTLSFILVNYWGMVGVAIGTVIAYAIEKLLMIFILEKKYAISPQSYIPLKQYVVFSICLFLAFIIIEIKFSIC